MRQAAPETVSFLVGTLSAIGAAACCILPLLLASFSAGGAWVSQLRAFERFFPVFVAISAAAFGFGFYRIYVRDAACVSQPPRHLRVAFWVAVVLSVALMAFPFVRLIRG